MRGVTYITALAALVVAAPASAATITVNEGDDNGTGTGCELREAVASANGNTTVGGCPTAGTAGTDTINFSIATPATIALASPITVSSGEPLIVDGPTADPADLVIGQTPANNRIFTANANLTLQEVSLEDADSAGGGAVQSSGTLTLTNTHFENNFTSSLGTGGCVSGDVVIVTGSSFVNNSATGEGGCIFANAIDIDGSTFKGNSTTGGGGGGLWANTSLTVTDTTFGGPSALDANTSDGASGGGGAIVIASSVASAAIDNSTFSGNETASGTTGGAVLAGSPGIVAITDSTFSANKAPGGGGGAVSLADNTSGSSVVNSTFRDNTAGTNGGSIQSSGVVSLIHDTFVDNASPTGDVVHDDAGDEVTLEKSIVADIGTPTTGLNCSGSMVDGGHNVIFGDIGGSSCPTGGTNVTGDPMIGALGPFGGPTSTVLMGSASSAVDLIPSLSCTQAEDQRGATRAVPPGGACDAGAVEVDFVADALIAKGAGAAAGDDVYNDDGDGQTKSAKTRSGETATFTVRAQNDAQLQSDALRITGPASNSRFKVTYKQGANNITDDVTGAGFVTATTSPDTEVVPSIKVKVKVKRSTHAGKVRTLPITVASGSFAERDDTVKAVVTAK